MSELNVTLIENEADSTAVQLNRKATDGDIIDLQKDGSTVGQIGSISTALYVASPSGSDSGLRFDGAAINPCTTAGAYRDNAIDLGSTSAGFKDLYLDGGVFLGGTSATNKLDDYEEGTWTPVYSGSNSSPTVTHSMQVGTYRKVGKMVTVIWQIRASAYSGGSGDLQVTGLPFTSSNATNIQAYGTVLPERFNLSAGRTFAVASIYPNSSYIAFWESGDNIDIRQIQVGELTGGIYLTRGTITYFVD